MTRWFFIGVIPLLWFSFVGAEDSSEDEEVIESSLDPKPLELLVRAVKNHDYNGCEEALSKGADPNGTDSYKETLLIYIARQYDNENEAIKFAKLFIRYNADVTATNMFGSTAEYYARRSAFHYHERLAQVLNKAGKR